MKIKMNKNEKKDYVKFFLLPKDREICFKEASKKEITTNYKPNELARNLHPDFFWVKVKDIILETQDTKTFLLEADKEHGTNRLPKYQSGQYITLEIPIEKGVYKRAYTISSVSKYLKNGEYQITIKRVINGIVSSYFWKNVEIGDSFLARGPYGEFTYEPLRDSNQILAIAGGSGITPIMAMAESVANKKMLCHMTIIYGAKTEEDLIFKKDLDQLVKTSDHLNIVYILSEEEKEGYLHGFITKDLIEENTNGQCSYFVCGPIELYRAMNKIFKSMEIPNKYIRHDFYPEFEKPEGTQIFQIKVLSSGEEYNIFCKANETIMDAMEKEGILVPKKCGVGVCGFCKSRLISGEVLTDSEHVKKADQKNRYIHPCATYPLSDCTIELPN